MERICKHCKISFDTKDKPTGWMANHTRWCSYNPKRTSYLESLKEVRNVLNSNEDLLQKRNSSIKEAWKRGAYNESDRGKAFRGKKHSEETKEVLRSKALASKHRRLKKGTVKYKDILLDSSWELSLAKRLDQLNIRWIRPEPLQWKDANEITHNYFPDFYLIDYDLYLDPKNEQAYKVQIEKIKILDRTYSNIVWITSLIECETFNIETLRGSSSGSSLGS